MVRGRGRGVLALAMTALGLAGCSSGAGSSAAKPAARPFQGGEISVAAVGDPKILELVGPQRGEWQASRGATVTIRSGSVEPAEVRGADVLIFPGDRLGDLVDARALAPLPESAVRPPAPKPSEGSEEPAPPPPPDPLAFDDIASSYRDEVTKYGDQRMGLPLGGSALVLVYRRDALEGKDVRAAAERAGVAPEPKTWEQLDALARFLHGRDWDGDARAESGLALAWGRDEEGVGDAILLARAAALGLRPDQYSFAFDAETMAPRIDSPPFVAALEALAKLKATGPEGAGDFDAEKARGAFRAGEVALLIDRAERAASWTDPKRPVPVGVLALPGAERVYDPGRKAWETAPGSPPPSYLPAGGGWLVGLSAAASGRRREAAIDFIKYLAGPETTGRLLADRTVPLLPVRNSQVGQGPPGVRPGSGVDARTWSRAVGRTLAARAVPGLRIPEAGSYLADLGKARVAAVAGTPADAALKEAARAWSARVESLGRDRQRWHYRRSLNKIPTPPEPPDRPAPAAGATPREGRPG
jgi:multiple sugar transport system substrate-binding protein